MNSDFIYNNDLFQPIIHLLTAAAIGLLIGVEREFSHRDRGTALGGARTFSLVATLGYISALLADRVSPLVLGASLIGVVTVETSVYIVATARKENYGATTGLSLLFTFVLGALIFHGHIHLAVAAGVLMTVLLSLKLEMNKIVGKITREDLRATLKFIIVSVLVLPLLPNSHLDPYGIINPREIWTFVVLVLSISFVSYLLSKFWRAESGIFLTGILGGLVSSTALTWVLSRKSKGETNHPTAYASGIFIATSLMYIRLLVLIFILNRTLASVLAIPFLSLFSLSLLGTIYLRYKRSFDQPDNPQAFTFGNPFNLSDAIKFGLVFSLVLCLIYVGKTYFGKAGVLVVSTFSGLVEMDAITVSLSRLSHGDLSVGTAAFGILLATIANNIFKYALSLTTGAAEMRNYIHLGFIIILLLGVGAAFFTAEALKIPIFG